MSSTLRYLHEQFNGRFNNENNFNSIFINYVILLFIESNYWRRVEARRQYWIGFNCVPWGDIIEEGATNIIIVKKNSVICLEKKKNFMNK